MRTSGDIDKLIDACVDDERLLEHESRFARGRRRRVLENLAHERAGSVDRLSALDDHATCRAHRGSWLELVRELGRNVRRLMGGQNDGDSISACRRSCRRAEERFDEALEHGWSPKFRSALVEERARLESAYTAMIAVQY